MIDEIRDRLKLSEVIGKQHKLRPAGRDRFRVSPCPLCGKAPHNAPFTIDDAQGLFNCFACGKGGSVVDWKILTEGVELSEAVVLLAAEAGVTLRGEETPAKSRAVQVRALVAEAGVYYHERLQARVRKVVHERWGLTDETIDRWQLGWCDNTWLAKQKSPPDLLAETGLVVEGQGGPREILKGRLTLPWLRYGKPCYLVGRTFEDDVEPKYLNQKATETMPKPLWGTESLVGADRAILVEGIFDGLAVWQALSEQGESWAIIAATNNKLRPEDAELVAKNRVAEVFIIPDVDDAGIAGGIASAQLLVEAGIQAVYVVQLPAGDPAQFLLEKSEEGQE